VSHEDALAVLRPSGPSIDPIANLMARVVAQKQVRLESQESPQEPGGDTVGTTTIAEPQPSSTTDGEPAYWLTPVSDKGDMTPQDVVHRLVGQDQIYGFGKHTPGRKDLEPGDQIAFYASGNGVVAHAEVASPPERHENPSEHLATPDAEEYPYLFRLRTPSLYLENPVVIDRDLRGKLEAF